MPQRTFEVTYTTRVTAGGYKSAAKQVRAHLIDPGTTGMRVRVQRVLANGARPGNSKTIEVQDPDRSDE